MPRIRILGAMRKKKVMGRPPKDPDKKLVRKVQVGLSDTDFKDLELYKKEQQVDEDSDAARRLLRWAMSLWKAEKGKTPPSAP